MKLYHVTPWKNIRAIKKRGLAARKIRRGVFAQDPEEPRIYLFVDPETAEDGMVNWLLDEHPRVRYFGVIEVELPDDAPVFEDPELAGSVYVVEDIPAELITEIEKVDAGKE